MKGFNVRRLEHKKINPFIKSRHNIAFNLKSRALAQSFLSALKLKRPSVLSVFRKFYSKSGRTVHAISLGVLLSLFGVKEVYSEPQLRDLGAEIAETVSRESEYDVEFVDREGEKELLFEEKLIKRSDIEELPEFKELEYLIKGLSRSQKIKLFNFVNKSVRSRSVISFSDLEIILGPKNAKNFKNKLLRLSQEVTWDDFGLLDLGLEISEVNPDLERAKLGLLVSSTGAAIILLQLMTVFRENRRQRIITKIKSGKLDPKNLTTKQALELYDPHSEEKFLL